MSILSKLLKLSQSIFKSTTSKAVKSFSQSKETITKIILSALNANEQFRQAVNHFTSFLSNIVYTVNLSSRSSNRSCKPFQLLVNAVTSAVSFDKETFVLLFRLA